MSNLPPRPSPLPERRPGGLPSLTATPPTAGALPPAGRAFLDQLIRGQLVNLPVAQDFVRRQASRLAGFDGPESLGNALVQAGLLTQYQLGRVLAGKTYGLVLGNYRVLDRLGSGSVGVVFRGEHVMLRRQAAIKVLPVDDELPASILDRFYSEMRVLADLHHPHIVTAYDAGSLPAPARGEPALHYMVMELMPGGDLEQYVYDHGVLSVPQACEWVRQAASGLQEAHDRHLIHRDLKPSNLLRTAPRDVTGPPKPAGEQQHRADLGDPGQVKIVDFGLAREFCSTRTDPRMLLGSIEFMAPEQSIDPSAVGPAADIYALGATLFWLLTGQTPFPMEQNIAAVLKALQHAKPRRLREFAPEAPPGLDELIAQMLERDPHRRPRLAVNVKDALAPYAAATSSAWEVDLGPVPGSMLADTLPLPSSTTPSTGSPPHPGRVLLVDADDAVARLLIPALEPSGCTCELVEDPSAALVALRARAFDLVLIDLRTPGIDGYALLAAARERPRNPYLKAVLLTDRDAGGDLARGLARGVDDVFAGPHDPRDLAARVQYLLRLKHAQDRADKIVRNLTTSNRQLEDSLLARSADVRQAQDAMLFAMAKMAESREGETADHLRRLQQYALVLADHVKNDTAWVGVVDRTFLENLERCVPLHDIGKIGLPDQLLLKPGALDTCERALMETHTLIGAGLLEAIGKEYGDSLAFLGMARSIVRHHHEKYDGSGYPDKLVGEAIPAAARLVAVADVYDALRRKRVHKPPLSHAQAVEAILRRSPGHFDPVLLHAFQRCEKEFARIYQAIGG
jgi:response regulator RpfG family c-di-GMP phosphodiesterase/serine/threonine protein kinase